MKFKLIFITLVMPILLSNNSFAFKFGEIESGLTYEETIDFAKKNNLKFNKLKDFEYQTFFLEYHFNNERWNLVLQFSNVSKRLFSLVAIEHDSKNLSVYKTKFDKLKESLDNIYGKPRVENYTIGIIGVPKTIPDNPNTYIYEKKKEEVSLTFSEKIPLLTLQCLDNKYRQD